MRSAIQGKGRELQLVTFKPGRFTAPGTDQQSALAQEEHFVLVKPDRQLSEALASEVKSLPKDRIVGVIGCLLWLGPA